MIKQKHCSYPCIVGDCSLLVPVSARESKVKKGRVRELVNQKRISLRFSESRLQESNKELSFLFHISSLLSASLNPREVLDGAITKVLEHFDYDAGRIYLKENNNDFFKLAGYKGIDPDKFEKVMMQGSVSGKAVRTESFIAQQVAELEDKKRSAFLLEQGFKFVICVPLIVMDKIVGVMNLTTKKIINLKHREIDLLIATANLIASAVNNAVIYEDRERKVKEIEEKNDTIKFFAFSVSHDLKSPAVGLHGLTKLLHKRYGDTLDARGREYCDRILKAARHIEELVEKINHYIKAKEAALNIEKINMKEVVEMVRSEFSDVLKRRQVKWSAPDTMPEISADRLSIIRVFQNFIDNSLKYGGDDLSEIKLEYRENNSYHIFSVSDDGVGVQEEDHKKLFKLFQRSKTSNGADGSGMGLAIVKAIAERHGGRVWLDPGPEKGTTFHIAITKNHNSEEKDESERRHVKICVVN